MTPPSSTPTSTWIGRYLDGHSAASSSVRIEAGTAGLMITKDDGSSLTWPYEAITRTQGTYDGEHIRLEHGMDPIAAVVITDQRFLTALRRRAPGLVPVFHDPTQRRLRLRMTALAAALTLLVTGALYKWGIPGLATVMTPYVPITWEQRLGQDVVEQFAPEKDRCTDPYRIHIIESLLTKLTATVPENPYGTIHFHIVDEPIVNAFAAPGGYVVVFRGLLEKTETPEQLAGVLAHELQHIFKRHTTRAILEQTSTSLLVAAVSGDLTGAATLALDSARTLGALQYSRSHEGEADAEGMKMLVSADINPQGMIEFFELLGKHERGEAGLFRYLSTHPTHHDRVQALSRLAASSLGQPQQLLPGLAWSSIRTACKFKKRISGDPTPSTPIPEP